MLALCGKKYPDELPFSDNDLGSRLKFCQWNYDYIAYTQPEILQFDVVKDKWPQPISFDHGFGPEALTRLEAKWDEEVEKFMLRCQQQDDENTGNPH